MERDPFKEYLRQSEPGKRERSYAWHTAIGLQAVDGLTPSKYLVETAARHIEGEISIDRVQRLLESYYAEKPAVGDENRTEEADKVSARIAMLLSERAFSFSPTEYLSIHRKLFAGIYRHAGRIRDYNITKREWVLDGATVIYGSAFELRAALDYDLCEERNFSYRDLTVEEMIHHLAVFVSRLWQIHVFEEGNTRTTAVFFIKYIRTLGFEATNEIFAEHAWYFRNALVRANYNDLRRGIHETTEYLELFLRNLLLGEKNELHNRSMHISGEDFPGSDSEKRSSKQDIEAGKQDIENRKQEKQVSKQDIHTVKQEVAPNQDFLKRMECYALSWRTMLNIKKLFEEFGYGTVFGRSDVMRVLGITASPASELIRKLSQTESVTPVRGKGKGKYMFADRTQEKGKTLDGADAHGKGGGTAHADCGPSD